MYINKTYLVKTKTNLHVGSGDTNFGIVDKEVQRDTITNLPTINGSSLKGALKDHFEQTLASSNETTAGEVKPFTMKSIFGDKDNQGLVKFIDAKLLFLPLRSNKKPFYHVTSKANLNALVSFSKSMSINISFEDIQNISHSVVVGADKNVVIEDVECANIDLDIKELKKLFGINNLAIFTDEDFNEAISSLPVIARNVLENGKSTNLWYEEVVPRESIFYTTLCYYNNFNEDGADRRGKTDKKKFDMAHRLFEEKLLKDNVQIGANTSIGYGICTFTKIGASDE